MEKNKTILIFISSYFPDVNANVICAQQYIDTLKQSGYKIDIVTCGNTEKEGICEIQNDVSVYRYRNWYVDEIKNINQSLGAISKKTGLKSKLHRFLLKIEKIILHIYDLKNADFVGLNIDTHAIYELVKNNREKYCAMIAFSEAFSMPWIASQLKQKLKYDIPLVICEFDPFTRNSAKPKVWTCRRKYVEKKVLSIADKVMVPLELLEEYMRDFPQFQDKVVMQYFPTLREWNGAKEVHDSDKIICNYAGTFNKEFRNPVALFEIISKINLCNLQVHVYGGGCEQEISQYVPVLRERLVCHGYREKKEVFKAQSEADILINLGNSMKNMTPSKLFELIAFGKPIIHFYRTDDDSCRKYLEKYPCVLFVDERKNYVESAIDVEKFILQNAGKTFSYDEVTKGLKELRSDVVCSKFLKEIEELL